MSDFLYVRRQEVRRSLDVRSTGLCLELVEIHNDRICLTLTGDCPSAPNCTPRTEFPD